MTFAQPIAGAAGECIDIIVELSMLAAKWSVLTSTLKKVNNMASDDTSLMNSAIWKLAEFAKLRYPVQALLRACSLVAVNTRNATWFKVRGTFSKYAYQYAPP